MNEENLMWWEINKQPVPWWIGLSIHVSQT
jgi:hypothetical protein